MTRMHNPRVVAGEVIFPESGGIGSGGGWPKVSPRVPHLLLGFGIGDSFPFLI
jgi:hypothetical protein